MTATDDSSVVRVRLRELADALQACQVAFLRCQDEFYRSPRPGSGAAQAAVALPFPDPAILRRPGESGHRMVNEVLHSFLFTASEHLGGLAVLYAAEQVVFGAPPLIRSAVEHCSHAVWVLGDDRKVHDEDLSAEYEDRLARAYLEELVSAEQAQMNAKLLHGKKSQIFSAERARYRALKNEILARFPGTTLETLCGGRERRLREQVLPPLGDAVKFSYKLAESFGGLVDQETAEGIYGVLSNMSHPTLYPVRQSRSWIADPSTGLSYAHHPVDLARAENNARVALAAFYNALSYCLGYFDAPEILLNELAEEIEAKVPSFFL